MPYIPSDNEFVLTSNPDSSLEPYTLTFIIRRATRQERESYLESQKARMEPGEEIMNIDEWLNDDNIYLAIEKDVVCMVSGEYIIGPAKMPVE